jgi:hypothetical protein
MEGLLWIRQATTAEECPIREIGSYAGPLITGRNFGANLDIEGAEPKVMPWLLAQPNLRFLSPRRRTTIQCSTAKFKSPVRLCLARPRSAAFANQPDR